MIRMMIARWGIVAVLLVSACPAHAALRMLAEAPVATTSVGFDTASRRYATGIIAVGVGIPAKRSQDEADAFDLCATNAAWAISTEVRGALGLAQDELGTPNPSKPQPLSTGAEAVASRSANPTAEEFNSELNARAAAIGMAVASQLKLLRGHLHNGCGSRVDQFLSDAQVAFAVHACMSRKGGGVCDELVSVLPRGIDLTAGFTPSQFDKLYAWLTLAQARDVNTWFTLATEKPTEFTAVATVREVAMWPAPPPAAQAVEQLENLIDRLRATREHARKLSYLTPRLIDLSRDGLAHVVDVVDHPFAAALLIQETGGQAFTRISDEIARSRIMDCVRLHGSLVEEYDGAAAQAAKTPLERVASCAGVDATDDVLLGRTTSF